MEQSKSKQNKFIDIAIAILLFIACASFPFPLIFKNDLLISTTCSIALLAIYLVALIIYLLKNKTVTISRREINWKIILLFIPCLLATVSNYFYGLTVKLEFVFEHQFLLNIVLTLIVVIIEELLFRGVLQGNLPYKKPFIRILIASGLFALCHLNRFISSFNPADLLSVLYAFGLGLIVGLLYEYGGSLTSAIIFHLLFNLLNQVLFNQLTTKLTSINYLHYILINVGIAAIVGVYLLLVYLFILEKKEVAKRI